MNDYSGPSAERSSGSTVKRDLAELDADRRLAEFLDQENESALTGYIQLLLRRRLIVLAGVLLGIMGAIYVTYSTVPLYRATATLEINRQAARVVEGRGEVQPSAQVVAMEFYQTQYGLLKSRALAEATVRKLRLAENPTLLYGYGGKAPPALEGPMTPERRARLERAATAVVLSNLVVTPVRASSLVSVSFSSPDPVLSAQVVNAITESFIEMNLRRRFDTTAYARRFLEDRLEQTRARLEESDRKLVEYAGQQQIINLDSGGGGGSVGGEARTVQGQSLVAANLSALNSALAQAKAERIAAEAAYRQTTSGGGLTTAQGSADATVTALRSQRAQLQAEYQKGLTQFQPDYPPLVALRGQITELDRQLQRQSGNIVTTMRNAYQAALQKERQLEAQVEGLKKEILDLRRRTIQYDIFQRDADTNRELYESLLQRYKEVGIAGGVGTNNISLVDRALVPTGPFTPRTTMNLLIGLLLGLLAGGALAFLIEQLDESIVAAEDIERKLGVPTLGTTPKVAEVGGIVAALAGRKSDLAEAYLSVQTALRFSTSHGSPKTMLVTSARASEGKSTTAYAIASNFASLGKSAILVDADMRRPSVHKMLDVPNTRGLSNFLTGDDAIESLVQSGPIDRLSFMPTGPMPPNPSELLASNRVGQLIAQLAERYDHVIIDCPPVMGLADAPLVSTHVEATVFVITAAGTRTKAARMALRRLADVHAHVIGAVLTKFDARKAGYQYGYSYYGYGANEQGFFQRAKKWLID